MRLDRQLAVTGVAPMHDRSDGPARFPSRLQGYEDCRLLRVGGHWLASATVRDRNPLARCEIALLELDDAAITAVTLLRSPIVALHEKNWMPFSVEDQLQFVYSCAPTIVISCDPETGLCRQVACARVRARSAEPRDALRILLATAPAPIRAGGLVTRRPLHASWLRPRARLRLRARLAREAAAEPDRWDERVAW